MEVELGFPNKKTCRNIRKRSCACTLEQNQKLSKDIEPNKISQDLNTIAKMSQDIEDHVKRYLANNTLQLIKIKWWNHFNQPSH